MKVYLIAVFSLLYLINANAQNSGITTGIISGIVTNSQQKAIAFATVAVYQVKDTLLLKTEITDTTGFFSIKDVPLGNYFLRISRVGLESYFSDTFELNSQTPNKIFNDIQLLIKQDTLQTVTVVSQGKRLITTIPGGYLFNADANLIGKNGDALDMLKQVPGVASDNSDNITLRGGSPLVLINGKEIRLSGIALVNYLKNIQGSNISNIEIITSPTAKYPAAGEAGIIDIKLKNDNKKGVNGMLGAGINTQPGAVQYGGLNVKAGKLSFSADYNVNYGEGKTFSSNEFINKLAADSNYLFAQNSNGKLYNNWEFANATISYMPDTTLIIGGDFNFGRFRSLNNTTSLSDIYDKSNMLQDRFKQHSRQHSRNMYYMYDITMLKKLRKKGEELSGYLNAANYRNFNFLNFERAFDTHTAITLQQNNNTNLKYDFYTLKIDYKLPLNNKNKIETGLKNDYSRINNSYVSDTLDHLLNAWITDNSISNNFFFNDNTLGVYGTFSGSNKKLDYQIGLRFENYRYKFHQGILSGIVYSFSKNNLFPNFYLRYKFNSDEDISLSLGERIQRPGYGALNPFVNNAGYNYYTTGNPYLSPAFTYKVEIQYTKYWNNYTQLIMIAAGYNMIKNIIGQLFISNSQFDKPYYTYVNYQNSNRYTLNITGQNKITKWWNINSDFNARYATYSLNSQYNTVLPKAAIVYSFRLTNSFKFWKNASLQLTGQYLSSNNNFQNEVYPVSIASIVFQKALSKKWTINSGIEDIFYSQRNKTTTDTDALYNSTTSRTNSRYFIIRFTYRFGSSFDKPRKVSIESNGRM